MSHTLSLAEDSFHVEIEITDEGEVLLLHCAASPFVPETIAANQRTAFRLVEVQVTGENREGHHDTKHLGSQPGARLRYVGHHIEDTSSGRLLSIEQADPLTALTVVSYLQFFTELPVLRSWTEITNRGEQALGIEYLSSFALTGLAKEGTGGWETKTRLGIPHHSWFGECQWRFAPVPELGLWPVTRQIPSIQSLKRLLFQGLGTWSTAQYLPMGYLENQEAGLGFLWQIEHHGSWVWEISDVGEHLYLRLSGPTDQESQWWHPLAPGATFTSVPVALAVGAVPARIQTNEGFEACLAALTQYRRLMRRPHPEYGRLPVIFNDFMNCLDANPTTEKELPLIRRAAEAGCEVYCIDAGWYAPMDADWWDRVGEWQPSSDRFVGGLETLIEVIRAAGMQPGLWIEIEVMGIQSPLAQRLPDEWFFCRHGKRVIDHGRYQLDFRHPDVRAFATSVIDRLVRTYSLGYLKIDYNINAGIGTDVDASSPGMGLLGHQRAYLDWITGVMDQYPELIIENCASGGMRMDYALLGLHSIQSTSDQMDYRLTSVIAASAPTAVTPEQGAVWAYPLASEAREAVITNLVNALLGRIHLSGHLADLNPAAFALVQEAIAVYKTYRLRLPHMVALWPWGLPTFESPWTCLGLHDTSEQTLLLSIWRLDGEQETMRLPLPDLSGQTVQVATLFPGELEGFAWKWLGEEAALDVSLSLVHSACLLRLTW